MSIKDGEQELHALRCPCSRTVRQEDVRREFPLSTSALAARTRINICLLHLSVRLSIAYGSFKGPVPQN